MIGVVSISVAVNYNKELKTENRKLITTK